MPNKYIGHSSSIYYAESKQELCDDDKPTRCVIIQII